MIGKRGTTAKVLAVGASVAIVAAACGSNKSSASGAGNGGGTITFGQLLPFTGSKAFLSSWAVHGDAAAVYDVNHNGGVMGQQLGCRSSFRYHCTDSLPLFCDC